MIARHPSNRQGVGTIALPREFTPTFAGRWSNRRYGFYRVFEGSSSMLYKVCQPSLLRGRCSTYEIIASSLELLYCVIMSSLNQKVGGMILRRISSYHH